MSEEELFERRLTPSFFARDALVVARALIGTYVVHVQPGGTADATAGGEGTARVARVVETEAYRGPTDLACHARVGLTRRTRTLLGAPGHAYVFLIYGMYDCFNVVCHSDGRGHAVLIRAGEPVSGVGIETGVRADGPGRFARALGITRRYDGHDLTARPLYLSARAKRPRIATSARVGVAYAGQMAEVPWRFFDAASEHVSRPSKRTIGLGVR